MTVQANGLELSFLVAKKSILVKLLFVKPAKLSALAQVLLLAATFLFMLRVMAWLNSQTRRVRLFTGKTVQRTEVTVE